MKKEYSIKITFKTNREIFIPTKWTNSDILSSLVVGEKRFLGIIYDDKQHFINLAEVEEIIFIENQSTEG